MVITIVTWRNAQSAKLGDNFCVIEHSEDNFSEVLEKLKVLEAEGATEVQQFKSHRPSGRQPVRLCWRNGSDASHDCPSLYQLKKTLRQVRANGAVHPIWLGEKVLDNKEKKAAKKGGKMSSSKNKCKKRCSCQGCKK